MSCADEGNNAYNNRVAVNQNEVSELEIITQKLNFPVKEFCGEG